MSKVKQVILFHPMKFVCRSFEAFAKDIGVLVYSLEEVEEFCYLIDELKPELILFQQGLYAENRDSITNQIAEASFLDFQKVIIGPVGTTLDSDFKLLEEPFEVSDLENIFKHLLAEHH